MVDYFKFNINYIQCPFPAMSHGWCMNQILRETIDSLKPDYYFFLDSDAIFLKKEAMDIMYDFVKNKRTLFGITQQSNHKKNNITNSKIHAYVSQACVCFPSKIYNELNRPCMDHWSDGSDEFGGDTAERLTYEAKKKGYLISMIYPSNVYLKNSNLDSGLMFGMGNTYSDLVYHVMQQDNPISKDLFIEECKKVINGNIK